MQYVERDIQAVFQKIASCHELGIPFKVENGVIEQKKRIGFLPFSKKYYESCFILTIGEEGEKNEKISHRGSSEGQEDDLQK